MKLILQPRGEEATVSGKLALLVIGVTVLAVLAGGIAIGKAFFWDRYRAITKLDRDLEIALANAQRDPNNAEYRIALGWVYFQQGKLPEAVAEYQNALQLEPENMKAKFNLASAYIETGQLEDAQKLMEEYVRKNPLHAGGHSILGLIYSLQGNYEQAIAEFRESIRLVPGNTNVYYQLAETYEKAGNLEQARAYYQKTLDYNPKYTQAQEALDRLRGK